MITNAIPSATAAAMGGMSGEPSLRFCSTGGIAWISMAFMISPRATLT